MAAATAPVDTEAYKSWREQQKSDEAELHDRSSDELKNFVEEHDQAVDTAENNGEAVQDDQYDDLGHDSPSEVETENALKEVCA